MRLGVQSDAKARKKRQVWAPLDGSVRLAN